ncbi:MAG: 50S ribosomal protein L15e, partial [Sulfolobales archaeon]
MGRSAYSYIAEMWKDRENNELRDIYRERLIEWRRDPVVKRIEHPTRLDRAREIGYKAKQ